MLAPVHPEPVATPVQRDLASMYVERATRDGELASRRGWHRSVRLPAIALVVARRQIGTVAGEFERDPDGYIRTTVLRAWARGEYDMVAAVFSAWEPPIDDHALAEISIELQIQDEQFSDAEEASWDAVLRFEYERSEFIQLWYRAHTSDPVFFAESPVDLSVANGFSEVRTLNAASSVLLRFYRDGHTVGLMKPFQTFPFSNVRGEIAAYRLCPLIHCDFFVPRNQEARIHEAALAELMGFDDVSSLEGVRRHDSALVFFEDDGQRYLYGTYKDWVPGFTNFPIEEVEWWRHLVERGFTGRQLRRLTFRDALPNYAENDPEGFAALLERLEGISVYDFAHQLSDLHVFDLLINNWDRYSSHFPSSNCQFNHGRFVSIDNGASFHTPEQWRGHEVELRLRRVQRFSRRTIDAVRWMDVEALYPILFPENGHTDEADREGFSYLEERRQFLLAHVDGLIERYGAADTLMFP